MPRLTPSDAWDWHLAWTGVFAANLIVPLLFGWEFTRRGGRIGMFVATVLTLGVGLLVVSRPSGLRKALVAGGAFTAITQVVPLLQMVAGMASLGAVARFGFGPGEVFGNSHSLTELGGFIVTLLTAGLLLTAALTCGTIMRATGRAVDRQIERKVRERP